MRDGITLRACCGCLLAWPWADAQEYEGLYQGWRYHVDEQLREGQQAQPQRWKEYVAAAESRMGWIGLSPGGQMMRGSLLDVGASVGALVFAASRFGFRAAGIEPSAEVVRWAWQYYQTALVCGTWKDMAGEWDLITCCDVIEHLTEPQAFMLYAAAHAPRLYVETPDWPGNCLPGEWEHGKHIRPRQHPCLFSEAALVELGARAGWKVKRTNRPIPGKLAILFQME